jgi:hypothetical protein
VVWFAALGMGLPMQAAIERLLQGVLP